MNSKDEKKVQSLGQKVKKYLSSEDFIIDFAVVLGFLGIFICKKLYS